MRILASPGRSAVARNQPPESPTLVGLRGRDAGGALIRGSGGGASGWGPGPPPRFQGTLGAMSTPVQRVLVVTAHPDDSEFGAGGTVAKLVREGKEVTYLIVTDGSKGSSDRTMTRERL